MTMLIRSCLLVLGLTLLAACGGGGVGQVLGLDKETPDEFTVVTRAPLTLPPDFGLRPPDPRNQRVEDDRTKNVAEAALFGLQSTKQKRTALSDAVKKYDEAELAMLQQAKAIDANADIRLMVDTESEDLVLASENFMDDFLFWEGGDEPGIVVDAETESLRLAENAGLGKSVSDGDTPMIRRGGENDPNGWF